jgi:hypothetical protein
MDHNLSTYPHKILWYETGRMSNGRRYAVWRVMKRTLRRPVKGLVCWKQGNSSLVKAI